MRQKQTIQVHNGLGVCHGCGQILKTLLDSEQVLRPHLVKTIAMGDAFSFVSMFHLTVGHTICDIVHLLDGFPSCHPFCVSTATGAKSFPMWQHRMCCNLPTPQSVHAAISNPTAKLLSHAFMWKDCVIVLMPARS